MSGNRLDPDKLLETVKEEERQAQRGKLKIYLGAAPGVGKTYTMLKDAAAIRKLGLDMVVGVVESHGRKDIDELLVGLEILPKKTVTYKGKEFTEFDLDAALMRNPGLILIDEMAHTNMDGGRHIKRWQDIKELLDRGIDVYTTLNVQHIESLNDDVAGIIHAPISEIVPDMMLDLADSIALIDLPPEDLLKRLQEGKVYFPEQAELAKEGFFRKGNLIALRELALRVTAERVGAQVLLYRQGLGIKHIWSTNEKILVCVGPGSESLQLIRSARRIATSLQVDWMAVHVDSPRVNLTQDQKNNVVKNLQVANRLGAETITLSGYDIVKTIINYAHEQNVTLIMTCKQIRPRWRDIFSLRLADEIVRHSDEISVYIMTDLPDTEDARAALKGSREELSHIYLLGVGIVMAISALNAVLTHFLNLQISILLYLIGVTVISLFGRVGPSIVTSILSVAAYGAFFLPTLYKFSTTDLGYLYSLVIMILLTQVISHLTIVARRQAIAAISAVKQTAALNNLSRQLASTRGVDKLLATGLSYISKALNSDVMALLPEDGILTVKSSTTLDRKMSDKDLSVAQWVFDLGQVAGLGTDTLPYTDALYVPLLASRATMGVICLRPLNKNILFGPEQMNFLETCANQIALTIEVDYFQDKKKQMEMEQEIDHTRNVLLQSVSQDLRAPLAAIMLTANTQMQLSKQLDPSAIIRYGEEIYAEAEQLSRLINNLLQITYLESSVIKLQKIPGSIKDLITKVLKTSRAKIGKTPIYVKIPIDIPEVPFDRTLLEGVLINLIDNALKFAPSDKPVEIFAIMSEDRTEVIVSIEDHGPGIVQDEVNLLFEKFYRGRMISTEHGLGLGLAICRLIIEAHGGKIWAENRSGGGAAFKFSLFTT